MYFGATEEQAELRDTVREVLRAECPPEVVRAAWETATRAEAVRRLAAVAARLGVPGLQLSEADGGLGFGPATTWAVWEATGHAALPISLADTAAVAVPLLATARPPGGAEVLARLLDGEALAAVATDPGQVPYAGDCEVVIVLDEDGARWGRTAELDLEALPTLDRGRPLSRVRRPEGLSPIAADPAYVAGLVDQGRLANAAQLVGLSRRMVEMTVDYVRNRNQFGQPVGAFQAVKHALAELQVRWEEANATVAQAAWSSETGAPTAGTDLRVAAVLAAECGDLAAHTTIQAHGAMGYTTEYDLHLYAKRAWTLASAYGTVDEHLDRIVGDLGLDS